VLLAGSLGHSGRSEDPSGLRSKILLQVGLMGTELKVGTYIYFIECNCGAGCSLTGKIGKAVDSEQFIFGPQHSQIHIPIKPETRWRLATEEEIKVAEFIASVKGEYQ